MTARTYDKYATIHEAGLQTWHIGQNDWTIATESPTSTVARANLSTTKKRSTITGELKIHTKTQVAIILRLGFGAEFAFQDTFCEYTGPRTTLRHLLRWISSGNIYIHARLDLESEARKAGISEFQILEAHEWDGNDLDRRTCLNLFRLLQKEQ